jgi:hypothetical protein
MESIMISSETAKEVAGRTAKGVVREQSARAGELLQPPVDQFKVESAERIEDLADHVRQLGRRLDRRDEAHALARRLERTADYLRYRPAGDVAADAFRAVTRSPLAWTAAGLLGSILLYRVIRRATSRES